MSPPPQADEWAWSGTAKRARKGTAREWLTIAGIAIAVGLAAYGLTFVAQALALIVIAAGYGAMLSWVLHLVSRVGPPRPLRLDRAGLWFDSALLFPLSSIHGIRLLPGSQAFSGSGVSVRGFAGGFRIYGSAGATWFELSVPTELIQLARSFGIHVMDPPQMTR
ncbi:MAG: hypothetical protein HOV80_12995 [Polyangiaceae bacterium]|nr:hypothetical protein [Polyangiaceae bacterium]